MARSRLACGKSYRETAVCLEAKMTRPQQVPKAKVLGNFKARGLKKPKHKNSTWREDREGMDEKHLTLIRQLPCVHCLKVPAGEAHHLKCTGERGMAVRSTDRWTVPLCRIHHDEVERTGARKEVAWFAEIGIDPLELAQDLWSGTGDLPKMVRILTAHRV
jgi:hypothetical protein